MTFPEYLKAQAKQAEEHPAEDDLNLPIRSNNLRYMSSLFNKDTKGSIEAGNTRVFRLKIGSAIAILIAVISCIGSFMPSMIPAFEAELFVYWLVMGFFAVVGILLDTEVKRLQLGKSLLADSGYEQSAEKLVMTSARARDYFETVGKHREFLVFDYFLAEGLVRAELADLENLQNKKAIERLNKLRAIDGKA